MATPFQFVGRCIYCDSTQPPLTREHVLARGLGGNRPPNTSSEAMVLLKATCEECRETTRKFEDECLNGMFGPARARMSLSRKDRAKPDRRAKVVYRDGREEERGLDVGYIPGAMVIPNFSTAALFLGLDWRPGPVEVMQTVIGDPSRLRDPDIHQIAVQVRCDLKAFARMLSKIALGIAHYTLGPDAFHPIGRDFIRFGTGHPNHYVGGFADLDGAPRAPHTFHNINLCHYQTFLVATIQLFAAIDDAPVNYAVVGPLRRMPPGLPLLHLGSPSPRRSKIPDPQETGDPTTGIRWDRISP